ncbi:MAG: 16S rRNA (cytosine(967)-C(5))-methyltransferase RsmB [Candidatus Helarchaeales archaeon]
MNGINRELLALEILDQILTDGISEREAIKNVMQKYKVNDYKIRGAIHALVFETLRRLNILDKFIYDSLRTKSSFKKLDSQVKNILRLGIYEIKFTNKSAALVTNELSNIALDLFNKPKKIVKFINAILRKVEKVPKEDLLKKQPFFERLSLEYQYPTWYVKYLTYLFHDWNEILAFLKTGNEIPLTTIRVNTIKTSIEELISNLKDEEYNVISDERIPDLIIVQDSGKPITWSKYHQLGHFYIQSKSSIMVPHVLDPKPNQLIYDFCAAPGGKTTHIAQLMRNHGKIVAFERSWRRTLELNANIKRLGVKNTQVLQFDSRYAPTLLKQKADKILTDVPCTGSGTIHSRPMIKWKFRPRDFHILTIIQFSILSSAARLVKPKGEIVYSTCSIYYEENEMVIGRFLKLFPHFKLVRIDLPDSVPGLYPYTLARRIYPHTSKSEGFFVAKLKNMIDEKES